MPANASKRPAKDLTPVSGPPSATPPPGKPRNAPKPFGKNPDPKMLGEALMKRKS